MDDVAVMKRFGACLREARLAAGLTQGELSKHAGLNRSSIANMEAGRQNAALTVLFRLSAALRVPVGALVGEIDDYRVEWAHRAEWARVEADVERLAASIAAGRERLKAAGWASR